MKRIFQEIYCFGFLFCIILFCGAVEGERNIPVVLAFFTIITGFLSIGKIIYTRDK